MISRIFPSTDKDLLRPPGYRQSVFSLLLTTLAINVLSLALPVITLQIYDRILPNPGSGTLAVLLIGVCVAIALETVLKLCRAYVMGRAGATYEHRMSCRAMATVLNSDLSQMGKYGIGEHLHRMSSIGKLKEFYSGYMLVTLSELAFVPVFLGLIIYIAGPLAAAPAVVLMAFVALSLHRGYRLRDTLERREKADDARYNFLIESLEGIHTLKAFSQEKFFARRYESLEDQSTKSNYAVTQETAETFNIGAIFSHLMVTAVICLGAYFVMGGWLTTGGLIATLLLSGRMMQPVQKALALWARYQDYALARENAEELFRTPQQTSLPRTAEGLRIPGGQLSLRDVSFRYNTGNPWMISGVNLTLRAGDCLLLTGEHASGKTTLLNMIAGIYPATQGDIYVDGENIHTYPSETLARHIGYIRGNSTVFRGTIRDNITCFGQTNDAQAREVSALLQVDRDVARLPAGFDTFLTGGDTDTISPGLKHRIAMARVLATKPKIILFDNADRSLDREGYVLIYTLLARLKGKVSMILVSDDLNISGLADQHLRLENGKLSENTPAAARTNIKPYRELRL